MPEPVAQFEKPHPILVRHDLTGLVEVGEIRDAGAKLVDQAGATMDEVRKSMGLDYSSNDSSNDGSKKRAKDSTK